jgi:hypothetical protein
MALLEINIQTPDISFISEGICLSGDCVNGFGTIKYEDGDQYTGNFRDGKPHGQGTVIHSNAGKIEGEFENGCLFR